MIFAVAAGIERAAGGWNKFAEEVPGKIRIAIDEIIEPARTGRVVISELEPTEKTYLGTKIEILVREFLGFRKGILDLVINDIDVDVKNTVGTSWMIPLEAIGKVCFLFREDDKKAICDVGLVLCRPEYLRKSQNQDKKTSLSAAGLAHVYWIMRRHPYPQNFWEAVDPQLRKYIVTPRGGQERLERLFDAFIGAPLQRHLIEGVAPQKDFMKRLRTNGGLRDALYPRGIVLLSGTWLSDRRLARLFGLSSLGKDEVVAFPVRTQEQLQEIKAAPGHRGLRTLAT